MTGCAPERLDECGCVCGQRVHVISICRDLTLTLSAIIKGDALITVLQGVNLVVEHAPAHEQAVGKEDGLRTRAMSLVVQPGSIDFDMRHKQSGLMKQSFFSKVLKELLSNVTTVLMAGFEPLQSNRVLAYGKIEGTLDLIRRGAMDDSILAFDLWS